MARMLHLSISFCWIEQEKRSRISSLMGQGYFLAKNRKQNTFAYRTCEAKEV